MISDMLFFLQNKLQSTPHDDLVKICDSFYDDEYVWNEKDRFFKVIGKRPISRRTADGKAVNINDILQEMRLRDTSGDFQPICASINLNNLPHFDLYPMHRFLGCYAVFGKSQSRATNLTP